MLQGRGDERTKTAEFRANPAKTPENDLNFLTPQPTPSQLSGSEQSPMATAPTPSAAQHSAATGSKLSARLWRAGQALRMAWQSSPRAAALWITLLLLSSVLPLAVAWVGKTIIDAVVQRDLRRALTWVGIELGLMMCIGAAQRGAQVARSLMGTRLGLTVNLTILRKTLTMQLKHFQDPAFYDQLTRARREASYRPLALTSEGLNLISALVTLLGFVALLLSFSPISVAMLLLAAFPAALAELRFSRLAYELRNRTAPQSRRLYYLEYVLASDEHAKEVMAHGLGPTLLARYEEIGERMWRDERGVALRRMAWVTLLAQLGTLSFYGCYLYIVYRTIGGGLGLGDMTLYVAAFRQGQQSFQSLLLGMGALYEHDLYMSNLLSFLAQPTESPPLALPAQSAIDTDERGIRFDDVGFQYPGQTGFALRHINLLIPGGRSLALVGHNGAGKTTFIKLLTGLYEPTEGRVLLDGQDIRSLPKEVLRARISVIFQDFNQYQLSAHDNVAYGDPPRAADDARVERAVELGGASEVIAGLPEGLNTQLGRWFDKGVDLSGGQWQRVALSRAFMRQDADVLVLDEPTAALDAEAEAEVFERVRTLAQGRTLILISHRFPTVRQADRIVVLEKSGVLESGSHAELLARGGLYATMFRKQAQGYE